jgi:putative ABC transport system permease protein
VNAPQRLATLVREGVAMASSQPVVTGVTTLVVMAVCALILATVGQTAAAEARVLGSIDDAGTRTIVVTDPTGRATMHADSVDHVLAIQGVDWALGLGPVVDVRNVDLGDAARPVPARPFHGALPSEIVVTGRAPNIGEALVGSGAVALLAARQSAAGIRGPGIQGPVVGHFNAAEPLAFLNRGILIASSGDSDAQSSATLRSLYVMADSIEDVDQVVRAVRAVIHADVPENLTVETPVELLELRAVVGSELAANSRRLMLLILSVGLVVIAITLVGAVSQRRRDFGRRRALGASRSAILVLVLTQTAVGAALGAALGCAVGLAVVWRLAGSLPSATFTGGVGLLALVTSLVAGVPPGLMAALRDPVRILRVP